MRVVQLITSSRGGPVDHAVAVATELAAMGHESHLVGPPGAHLDRVDPQKVHVHEATMNRSADVRGARDVARTVRAIAPDVLHCQDRRAGLVGRTVARGGAGVVYTLHGVPDSMAHLVRGNMRAAAPDRRTSVTNVLAERQLARTPRSMVVTPCEAVAEFARDRLGIPASRVVAVHNGVTPGPAGPVRPTSSTTTVAWLGVMQPVKRVPSLVDAVAALPDVRLLLIGDGPERSRIERAVAVAGIDDRVELVGFRDDPLPLLRSADVLALPSAAEACPMAVLQAMACGVPVVASRAGGIPEVVRDGVDGLLVPTGDVDALRDALRQLHVDVDARLAMGVNARERVSEQFTLRHCAERLLDVYGRVTA